MKVLLASSSSGSRGGGEKFLTKLGAGLVARGHEVTLWASARPGMDELCADFQTLGRVLRSPYQNTYDHASRSLATLWNQGTVRRLAAEWRSSGCDVIHVNKQNLEDGLDLLRAAKRSGISSLCTIHLTQTAVELRAKFGFLRDWAAKWGLHGYRGGYVTVERERGHALRAFLGGDAVVETIENGVEPYDSSQRGAHRAWVRGEMGWGGNHFVVCSVGRMVEQKRPLLFLEVALKFIGQDPSARFLWIGDGPVAGEWDERVRAAGMGERIRRLPWQESAAPYLGAADLYLHTAAYEGCPFALLEALSAGLPCVVAADLLRSMPILREDEVISFDPAGGLSAVELAPERLRQAAIAGQRAAETRFSLDRMAERYEAAYRQAALFMPRE